MDHPCHKCGQSAEDGVPFCSHCGAPQIRVTISEPVPVAGDVSSSELQVSFIDQAAVASPPRSPALPTQIDWPRAFRTCSIAALISILVMSLRLVVPLLALLGAGFFAVAFYRYRSPTWKVNARSGAQLGAVTGLLSSGIAAIFSAIVFAVLQSGGQVRQQVLETLQQVASRSSDPEVQVTLDLLKHPEGLASKLVLATLGFLLLSVAAGSLAGALTGAFFGRRNRP
jgi:zinc-ribbon domain